MTSAVETNPSAEQDRIQLARALKRVLYNYAPSPVLCALFPLDRR